MTPLQFPDVLALIRSFKDALPLLWKNKLWKGYFAHGPVSYLSIVAVLMVSYQSYVYFNPGLGDRIKSGIKTKAVEQLKTLANEHLPDSIADTLTMVMDDKMNQKNVTNLTEDTISIGDADTAMMASTADTMTEEDRTSNENTEEIDTATTGIGEAQDEKRKGTKEEKKSTGVGQYVDKKGMFSGGFKYFVIILLNMLIGHFCGRIIGMMGGFEKMITVKSYLKSQIRVLQIGLSNWIFEILAGVAVSIFCGLFFNDTFEMIGKKILHMFFLGYLFFDSYYDYFGLKTKESRSEIMHHIVTVSIAGAVAWAVMSIPYIGPLLGPILCSVAVTLFLAREKGLMLKPQT
jgi:uncharacterized protein involved in cysteine biosynthesis